MPKKRVAIALSGGVDSSVSALLLKKQGYEIFGLHMLLTESSDTEAEKVKQEQIEELATLCRKIGVPLHLIDLRQEFERKVMNYFTEGYHRGITPNPCVICNRDIKFDLLLKQALVYGADWLATGHYARVESDTSGFNLFRGKDIMKDQSYVLGLLPRAKLPRILFPLGNYTKNEVIKMAQQEELASARKKSSQDICFIKGKYSDYLIDKMEAIPGEIINKSGSVIGQHRGMIFYTVGQRCGNEIATSGQRFYVTKLEQKNNRILVGSEEELYHTELVTGEVNWITRAPPLGLTHVKAKIRYKSNQSEAVIIPYDRGVLVKFKQPQRAITPGQLVVFYSETEVLGGGFIQVSDK